MDFSVSSTFCGVSPSEINHSNSEAAGSLFSLNPLNNEMATLSADVDELLKQSKSAVLFEFNDNFDTDKPETISFHCTMTLI